MLSTRRCQSTSSHSHTLYQDWDFSCMTWTWTRVGVNLIVWMKFLFQRSWGAVGRSLYWRRALRVQTSQHCQRPPISRSRSESTLKNIYGETPKIWISLSNKARTSSDVGGFQRLKIVQLVKLFRQVKIMKFLYVSLLCCVCFVFFISLSFSVCYF